MPPSARVLAEASEPVAAGRGTTVRQLARRLSGDLDAIVCRALGAELTTRYATVEQLSHDLDCHRTKHPVSAREGDIAYLVRTFIRRHAVALNVGMAVALLIAVGVAAVLWQAAIAADARKRAERRFEEVKQLAHMFIFDVHDSLVNVPGTTSSRALMVRTAAQYLDKLAGEAAGDRALQRELASAFVKVGDAQGHPTSPNVGDTAGALASYRRAIGIATGAEQAAPGDLDIERTLAMAHRRLADVLAWSGNTTDALTECTQSLTLFEQFASLPSAPLEDRLQAAVAQIKLGDLLGNPNFPNLGRAGEAATRYDTALAELRRLAASSSADVQVRRYLGVTFERIGTLHEAARRWPEAAAAYQESFEIRRALAESQPAHVDIQRDLGIAHEKLGNVARFTGQLASAADSYRAALAQFERLARTDPSNASAARTVAISREKLGQLVADMGKVDEATSLLRAAIAAHRGLAARDPENAQARCDTARVAEILGDVGAQRVPRGGAGVPASVCASWRESLATSQALRAGGRTTCGTEADIARITGKLRACR